MTSSKGLKLTRQRQIILEELRKVRTHPTAIEVYTMVRRRLPRISLATVYRNLEELAAAGLIQKLTLAGSRKRFDGTVEEHCHIRCLKCDRVDDVAQVLVPPIVEDVETLHGYQLLGHRLELFGICPRCQEKARERREGPSHSQAGREAKQKER